MRVDKNDSKNFGLRNSEWSAFTEVGNTDLRGNRVE